MCDTYKNVKLANEQTLQQVYEREQVFRVRTT